VDWRSRTVILVDSTVYIDWFRQRIDPRPLLESFIKARSLAVCGIVRAEVVRGIIRPAQKMRVDALFDLMEDIAFDSSMWRQIVELSWRLDRQGDVLPLTDIAIACCALCTDSIVITTDEHFKKISNLKISRSLPASH
jgi:predicted nucleic acid-binding protein